MRSVLNFNSVLGQNKLVVLGALNLITDLALFAFAELVLKSHSQDLCQFFG